VTAAAATTAPAGGPPDPLLAPLAAVDDMRATAKWTLAVAGAVGAALIGGGPLVAVGQVHGTGHAVVAGAGLACALAGVMLAIWFTTRVLLPRLTTPAVFTTEKKALAGLTAQVDRDRSYFFGELAASTGDLLARRAKTLDAIQQVGEALADASPAVTAGLEPVLARLQSDLARIDACARTLLAFAHAWLVERDLRRSRGWTLGGGILVVAGSVVFFSVTGSAGPAYVPVLTTTPAASAAASP
jgi:hypothetical protein